MITERSSTQRVVLARGHMSSTSSLLASMDDQRAILFAVFIATLPIAVCWFWLPSNFASPAPPPIVAKVSYTKPAAALIGAPSAASSEPSVASPPASFSPKGPKLRTSRGSEVVRRAGARAREEFLKWRGTASKKRPRSTPPERVIERAQHLARRALSPNTRRIKQVLANNVELALFESSGARYTQSLSDDGSRIDRSRGAKRMQTQRPTLPRQHSSSAATELPASISMPTDASPWDRLHVWLCDGADLPRRPRFWPFEPCVVVTAVGDDTGSNIASPIGAYEFQVRQKHMNDTHPVWDEQGMLCFKRSGTSGFRVEVLGNGKIWSGLYHAHVLRPLALMRTISTFFMVDVLVFLPLRLLHRLLLLCCSVRQQQQQRAAVSSARQQQQHAASLQLLSQHHPRPSLHLQRRQRLLLQHRQSRRPR